MMRTLIDQLIQTLDLRPLPEEGGYFRQTYKSPIEITIPLIQGTPPVARSLGTGIFYLITPMDFSALHRLPSDEMFHFYLGDPVEMLQIGEDGESKKIILGQNIMDGQRLQAVVPANTWQGTRLIDGGKYALLGVTVCPGFEFADFELGKKSVLASQFPHLKEEIDQYSRDELE